MKITEIDSYSQLRSFISGMERSYLLLYKSGSELSECTLDSLRKLEPYELEKDQIFAADVNRVRDIHAEYGIGSVPTLLEFKSSKLLRLFKGCNDTEFYRSVITGTSDKISLNKDNRPAVTVYTTPTCSWCRTLKSYLMEHRVKFSEIDVSTNQKAAEEMVRKSGQQGVPQTDINGKMVIGFDRNRLDQLLSVT